MLNLYNFVCRIENISWYLFFFSKTFMDWYKRILLVTYFKTYNISESLNIKTRVINILAICLIFMILNHYLVNKINCKTYILEQLENIFFKVCLIFSELGFFFFFNVKRFFFI